MLLGSHYCKGESMRYIYLAGPMTGVRLDVINVWRKEVESAIALSDCTGGVTTVWPTRDVQQISGGPFFGLGTDPKVFMKRDRYDVSRSELVLFNFLGATERGSLGCAVEFGWASAMGKPILMAVDDHSVHRHAMLVSLADAIVDNVPDLIELAMHFLQDR